MTIRRMLPALILVLALAPAARAQMPDPQEMLKGLEEMMEFAKDVRVDEDDIASILAHYEDFQPVAKEIGLGMRAQGAEMDFDEAEKHPKYMAWAESHGLDPGTWGRKMVRAGFLLQREAMASMGPQMTQMLAQQKQMLEAQKDAMGADQYKMMTDQMAGWEKGLVRMNELVSAMEPTEAETKAIAKHQEELKKVFGVPGMGMQ